MVRGETVKLIVQNAGAQGADTPRGYRNPWSELKKKKEKGRIES